MKAVVTTAPEVSSPSVKESLPPKIAGVRVTDGKILRNARVRLIRNSEIIFDGGIESMRHLTQNVTELTNNLEGGIVLNGFHELEIEDLLECYELK